MYKEGGCHQTETKFNDYKKCLENNKTILRWQQRFRSELHNTFMEKTNKISLSTIDYKTLKTFD